MNIHALIVICGLNNMNLTGIGTMTTPNEYLTRSRIHCNECGKSYIVFFNRDSMRIVFDTYFGFVITVCPYCDVVEKRWTLDDFVLVR